MCKITVFTPTYNRGYLLHNCYESLKRQTNLNFVWLIIDDGSTDNTFKLVEKWKRESIIPIKYHYKKNGGMHSAYNVGYEIIDTELAVCVDSDDYLTDTAIELVLNYWEKYGEDKFAGIVGLDVDLNGSIIGKKLPNQKSIKIYDYYNRFRGSGDKKMVYRTELMKNIKSPEYEGERLFATCYRYFLLDLSYDMLILNIPLCVVDYASDGFTKNIFTQYKKNSKSFLFYRKFIMQYPHATVLHKYRFAIHYIAESIMARNKKWFVESPQKLLTLFAGIPGIILYLFIKLKMQQEVL